MKSVGGDERDNTKQSGVVDELRHRILTGVLTPGSRLPNREELRDTFGVSMDTVQGAMDRLLRDGFLVARRRAGTFVVDRPPHRHRYALVFWSTPGSIHWSMFFEAMAQAAAEIERDGDLTIVPYYGVDGHADAEDYQSLIRDIHARRLAGIIFASAPQGLNGTPILDDPWPNRVAVQSPTAPSLMSVEVDPRTFVDRGLRYLRSQGRRRVAYLSIHPPSLPGDFESYFTATVRARGMTTKPCWQLFPEHHTHNATRNLVHLLMNVAWPTAERPDGLLIADDHLVENACAGLVAAGVRVARDVDVVAHANFPIAAPAPMPLIRLGFDARIILESCLSMLDARRAGDTRPDVTNVSAVFEPELTRPRRQPTFVSVASD